MEYLQDSTNMKNQIILFLENLQTQGKKDTTARNYQLYLSRFVEVIGDKDIEKLTPQDVVTFQNHINSLPLSANTKSYHSVALRSFLVYLVRMGHTVISPHVVQLPKYSRKESDYLTEEELDRLLNAPKDIRDRAVLAVLASTGVRVSELCNIKLDEVNIKEKEIKVFGKGSKYRVVFLTDIAYTTLLAWLQRHEKKTDYIFYPYAFPSIRINPRSIERLVDKYKKLAGITKDCHPHTLRHSMASLLLRKGLDLRYVQKILGHTNISTTTIYTHTTDADLHENFNNVQKGKRDELEEIRKTIAILAETQRLLLEKLEGKEEYEIKQITN